MECHQQSSSSFHLIPLVLLFLCNCRFIFLLSFSNSSLFLEGVISHEKVLFYPHQPELIILWVEDREFCSQICRRLRATSSVRRPLNKDSSFNTIVVSNTKNSSKQVEVYDRTNKKPDVESKNVRLDTFVTNDEIKNALIAKNVLCVSCAKNVLIPCHDYCLAKYKLNVHSNVRRALFTTPRTVVQIILWIVDSGCSKHMTGDRSLLKNFVEKFIGTVRSGNDDYAAIIGYGDYVQGNITICHVYYVEGLGHYLFSVGQFCDGDLEVAFRSKTCYVRNLEGDDLLIGDRESNLYTISILDMAASSPVCLMSKASSTKSWGKSKKDSHPPKLVLSSHFKLELLHMDLCGPMRVASINGKKYILVIVDDYSRFTWVYFLHSKDETPEKINKFIAQVQLNYDAKIHKIQTDNGTDFKNATLKAHYEKLGIMQQFSIARTPKQNGVVERRNRTLVEAARTMLIFS
ncbi:integrase, catalytic region, zinc finger, CCHC-type containing protein [Tanacetum coccineum]